MRKGRDGEKKMEKMKKKMKKMENNGENSGPLTSLPVIRLTVTDSNADACANLIDISWEIATLEIQVKWVKSKCYLG